MVRRDSCCPRSGIAARHGIALVNAPGLIDSGYRGEIQVLLLNTDRAAGCRLAAGDRIAQLVLVEVRAPEVLEVEALATSKRGAGRGSARAAADSRRRWTRSARGPEGSASRMRSPGPGGRRRRRR